MSKAEWTNYADSRPESPGVYEWRIPSRAVDGMKVIVAAQMRKRGAGYEEVISPSFDYWDGYRVNVPKGLEWREAAPENSDVEAHEQRLLAIDGLELAPCPYCNETPRIKGIQRLSMGTVICAYPQALNIWWFECCEWAKTPHLSDPRVIEQKRRKALEPWRQS